MGLPDVTVPSMNSYAQQISNFRNTGIVPNNTNLTTETTLIGGGALSGGATNQSNPFGNSFADLSSPQFTAIPANTSSTNQSVAAGNINGNVTTANGTVLPGGMAQTANQINSFQSTLGQSIPSLESSLGSGALSATNNSVTASSLIASLTGSSIPSSNPLSASGSVSTAQTRLFKDTRVVIQPFSSSAASVLGMDDTTGAAFTPLMAPISQTNGIVFPYQPSITFNHRAEYSSLELTHSIQTYLFYKSSPSLEFDIVGTFTGQTSTEGLYTLAVMHFCAAVTKMNFGINSPNPGLTPPLFLLSGFGPFILNSVPIIIRSASYSYSPDVETIPVIINGTENQVPVRMDVSFSVMVQKTPNELVNTFNIQQFRSGRLMQNATSGGTAGTGWI